jgi:hypothetical protein
MGVRRWAATGLLAAVPWAAACHETGDYTPTEARVARFLTLASADGRTALPADGVSRLLLVATISADAEPGRRTIAFSTSAGTLIGGQAGADGTRQVTADATGRALIELQSASQIGDAIVQAQVAAVPELVRQVLISFVEADPGSVIRFVAAPASAPADGATLTTFTVQLAPTLPVGTEVTFTATQSGFGAAATPTVTVPVDGSFRASADLESPAAIGSARVTASAAGFSEDTRIDFHRALPDLITVAVSAAQVPASADGSVTVTGTFLRDVGTVTAGTVATFSAVDSSGAPVGQFRNVTVVGQATPNVATADFFPGATAVRGLVTIVVGTAEGSATGTGVVEIVDPP